MEIVTTNDGSAAISEPWFLISYLQCPGLPAGQGAGPEERMNLSCSLHLRTWKTSMRLLSL